MVAALATMAVGLTGMADARPSCFGAASRDPVHRCVNPKLQKMVVPTPARALLITSTPCAPTEAPIACTFGPPASEARSTVALVGDSHAGHWRAALSRVAKALNWSPVSLDHPSCQLSRAVPVAPKWKQAECADWYRDVTRWLADHPEISTIVTSNHPGLVETARGQSQRAARVAGIKSALKALPPTVKHIIVIRDVPFTSASTLPCVRRAIRKHADAGRACAFPRRNAVRRDYYVVVARKLNSPRMQVVDLTHFFCGRRECYPVVGGALVYRDLYDHLTPAYAATLAPYLLEKIKGLRAAANPAGAGPVAHAAQACKPPRYPGTGYFTSLNVKHARCPTGKRLALAYYRCRTRRSRSGHCHHRVLHFRCHERRTSIPTEIDARVTCLRGERVVVHTYQQNR